MREGSYLEILGSKITLKGPLSARIFEKNKTPYELNSVYEKSQTYLYTS